MAGEADNTFNKIKLLYLNKLFKCTQDISVLLDAVHIRAAIKKDGKVIDVSKDQWTAILEATKSRSISALQNQSSSGSLLDVHTTEGNFQIDIRLLDRMRQNGITELELQHLSVAESLIFDSILMGVGKVYEETTPLAIQKFDNELAEKKQKMMASDEYLRATEKTKRSMRCQVDNESDKFLKDIASFRGELEKLAVESFVRPNILAIQFGAKVEIDEVFRKAADVFSSCESQLSAGHVPEAFQPLVYNLVDETAKGLSGNYDGNRYLNVVNSLPQEHTAFRIIVGAALAFAGLMLAAVAITLAVHSFGVSTPLSALGVAVGVDMMLAGFAMAAAAITLGMAGTATFFAASKHQKSEIAEKAEAFHMHQTARMGG